MLICIFRLVLCFIPLSSANDVFCGQLQVYKQQWFNQQAIAISSSKTNDLKECLGLCCSSNDDEQHRKRLSDCQAVTFMGVLEEKRDEPNCMLVRCNPECQLNDKSVLTEGVVSVLISRDGRASTVATAPIETTSVHKSFTSDVLRPEYTSIWVIALVIIVAVLCVGLNVGLISAYVCWRRQKSRKQKAHICTINTLHAFNPS
ncbi:unnamed protein product [Anisakis simplex]|uniref:MANEC domain-containing protein n=1 Tax=Anisakis simplex TaxID=6269 RepID=A0A0M3JUK6_ANISI|nr:unnamed protein product [Anisakis simplex]